MIAFGNDAPKCMQLMVTTYDDMLEKEEAHDDIIRDVIKALLSMPNSDFHQCFEMQKLQWTEGKTCTVDELAISATSTCNNIKTNGD